MAQETISKGSLLYHAAYGLCRVDKLMEQNRAGEEVLCYSMVPKKENNMKTRITFPAGDIKNSGFHSPVSLREANEILEYLAKSELTKAALSATSKTSSSAAHHDQIWDFAQIVFSYEKTNTKDRVKRQVLENSIKGLVGELAFAFNVTPKKAAEKVQKSMGKKLKTDSLVLDILEETGEEGSIGW